MTYLVVGDLHCRLQYLEDFKLMASRIVQVAKSKRPDFIVLLGDLLHEHARIHTATFNAVAAFVAELKKETGVAIYILIGNHDYVNASQFLTTEHPFNVLKSIGGVYVIDTPQAIPGGIVMSPYTPPGRFVEALDSCVPDWKDAKVVFGHQEIRGCSTGAIQSAHGDVWSPEWPMLISGHIHGRQKLGSNVHYIGAPSQFTFADDPDKTISMFDDNWVETRVDLALKKKVSIEVEACKFADVAIPPTCHVRLEVIGTTQEFAAIRKSALYNQLTSLGVKVIPRTVDVVAPKVVRNISYFDSLKERVSGESEKTRLVFQALFG